MAARAANIFKLVFIFIDLKLCIFYNALDIRQIREKYTNLSAHLQSSVFKLSKDLIDSIHEEGIVAYTS